MWQLFVSNNFFLKKIFEGHFLLLATYHLLRNKFLISSPIQSHHYHIHHEKRLNARCICITKSENITVLLLCIIPVVY